MTNPTPKPSGRRSHRRCDVSEQRIIVCPECGGMYGPDRSPCATCGHDGEIPDRRSPSAAGRSAEVYEIVVEIKRLALQRSHGGITNSAMLKTLHALCDSAIDIIREETAHD